jgi:hypothetical protein
VDVWITKVVMERAATARGGHDDVCAIATLEVALCLDGRQEQV